MNKTVKCKKSLHIGFWVLNILLLIMYAYFIPIFGGHPGDTQCWVNWSTQIYEHGLDQAYQFPGNNYFPLYQYILWAYGWIASSKEAIAEYVYMLKWVTFAFEIGLLWIIYKWIEKRVAFVVILFIALLNIGYFYNTVVWGQVDTILSFFVISSFYFLWIRKPIWGTVMMACAMAFKMQGIIFIPSFGLLLLLVLPNKNIFKMSLICALIFGFVILAISSPFLIDGPTRERVIDGPAGLVDYYPTVTVGVANMWSIFYGDEGGDKLPDATKIFGLISHKYLGLILFCSSSFVALLPIFNLVIKKWKNQSWSLPLPVFLLSTALISLSFFTFNTQMHERYIHPLMAIMLTYILITKDWLPFVLLSFAYTMNMESLIQNWNLENYDMLIFNRSFIGGIYVFIWIYLMFRFQQYQRKSYLNNETPILAPSSTII